MKRIDETKEKHRRYSHCCILFYFLALAAIVNSLSCFTERTAESGAAGKSVYLTGLDGMTWTVLHPMMRQGKLPVFERLVDSGGCAELETLKPTVSVMIWTSIATGKLPEKHGIFNWTRKDDRTTSGQLAITSNLRQCRALWNITSAENIRSLVVNWWATWPVEPVHGAMISNRALRTGMTDVFFPPELEKKLPALNDIAPEQVFYPLQNESRFDQVVPANMKASPFMEKQLKRELHLADYSLDLIEKMNPQFAAVYFRAPDLLEHDYWCAIEPQKFEQVDMQEPGKGLIERYYRYFDRYLGKLAGLAEKDTVLMVVSDHGMEAKDKTPPYIEALHLDELLQKTGLLVLDKNNLIDFKRSCLRDNGRYPPGMTRGATLLEGLRQDENMTVKDLVEKLRNIKTRQEGKPLFLDIRAGKLAGDDLILELNPEIEPDDILTAQNISFPVNQITGFIIHPRFGQHWNAPSGIFLAAGDEIPRNVLVPEASVLDVAPSILRLMGLPAAADMDGKPLAELAVAYPSLKTPFIETYENEKKVVPRKAEPIKSSIDEEISQELKSLGYIE